ncbi:WD40 repeat domain-containing protein [Limnoglobus roseus]|uniref:WD40 repeat domain-containing protein n=1 Tax=Limnoglobus roseus TaxID=2598579 RepID=A0A5C1ABJ9_9BACT|nr:WD40 repeat domain-containing protein [Limnoglobus roseus]QEL15965.1 WD40 repeat domain-containing protein [Limnoglobus roseus]
MLILSHVKQSVESLAFSPDGRFIAVGGTSGKVGLQIWSWATQSRMSQKTSVPVAVYGLWWLADGRLLVGRAGLGVHIYQRDPADLWVITCFHNALLTGITPTGHGWASYRPPLAHENHLFGIRLSAADVRHEEWSVPIGLTGRSKMAFALAGGRFLSVEEEYADLQPKIRVYLRSTATGEVLEQLTYPYWVIGPGTVAPDGLSFWIAYHRSIIRWQVGNPTHFADLIQNDSRQHFTALAFSPDGRHLAAAGNDQAVKFYDAETGQLAKTFTWDIGRMRSIAFSPDGTMAAAGSDTGRVVVWDVDV